MFAYMYDEETKEYAGNVDCQLDPLESEIAGKEIWLLPANSTWNNPLEPKEGFKVKFLEGAWQYEAIPEPEPEPEPTEEQKQAQVRFVRNQYLQSTDFTQLADAPLTAEEREQYKAYRTYLRDYTETDSWWNQPPMNFEEWKETPHVETDEL